MNVTKAKPKEVVIASLKGKRRVFIFGCKDCATLCKTGGEEQVLNWKKYLEESGFEVTGTAIPDSTCDKRLIRKIFREKEKEISDADGILLLACGSGFASVAEIIELPVVTALDTLFVGVTEKIGSFYERCSLCGDCMLNDTSGLCVMTRCAKGFVNGPCGGAINGKCEVNQEDDCFWIMLKKKSKDSLLFTKYIPPRNTPRIIRRRKD